MSLGTPLAATVATTFYPSNLTMGHRCCESALPMPRPRHLPGSGAPVPLGGK